jgi:hypothetical protein
MLTERLPTHLPGPLDTTLMFFPQRYLKKQVTPLFFYFQNRTNNWVNRPPTLMEQ